MLQKHFHDISICVGHLQENQDELEFWTPAGLFEAIGCPDRKICANRKSTEHLNSHTCLQHLVTVNYLFVSCSLKADRWILGNAATADWRSPISVRSSSPSAHQQGPWKHIPLRTSLLPGKSAALPWASEHHDLLDCLAKERKQAMATSPLQYCHKTERCSTEKNNFLISIPGRKVSARAAQLLPRQRSCLAPLCRLPAAGHAAFYSSPD